MQNSHNESSNIAFDFLMTHIANDAQSHINVAIKEEYARDYHSTVICVPLFTADLGRTIANSQKYPSHIAVSKKTRECVFVHSQETHDYIANDYFNLSGMLSWNRTREFLTNSPELRSYSIYFSTRRDLSSVCVQLFNPTPALLND